MVISFSGKIRSGKDEGGDIVRYLTSQTYKNSLTYEYWKLKGDSLQVSPFEIRKFADELKNTVCQWLGCTREILETREFKNKELGKEWWYYFNTIDNNIESSYLSASPYIKENPHSYNLVKLTPRKLLQILGTEAGRHIIHPDIWVNLLFKDYKEIYRKAINNYENYGNNIVSREIYQSDKKRLTEEDFEIPNNSNSISILPNWIITDNRFPNELHRIHQYDGISIRIERPHRLRFPEEWKQFDQSADSLHPRTSKNFLEFLKISNYKPYRELYKTLTHYSEVSLDNCNEFKYTIINDGTIQDLINKIKEILINEGILK